EQGYNTDARPLQYNEVARRDLTHAVRVDALPVVGVGGAQYRELLLDVNEPSRRSGISLDELRVYVSNNPSLSGYNGRTHTPDGRPRFARYPRAGAPPDGHVHHPRPVAGRHDVRLQLLRDPQPRPDPVVRPGHPAGVSRTARRFPGPGRPRGPAATRPSLGCP